MFEKERERAEWHVGKSVEHYLGQKSVATCHNCKGDRRKIRVELPLGTTMCPHCRHALFWERVPKNWTPEERESHKKWMHAVKARF